MVDYAPFMVRRIAYDEAVLYMDDPLGVFGNVNFVGNKHDSPAFLAIEFLKSAEYNFSRPRIEISRRLIREN